MTRVLVVEDQKRLAASLRKGLEEEGYEVATSTPKVCPCLPASYEVGSTDTCPVVAWQIVSTYSDTCRCAKHTRQSASSWGLRDGGVLTSCAAHTDRRSNQAHSIATSTPSDCRCHRRKSESAGGTRQLSNRRIKGSDG